MIKENSNIKNLVVRKTLPILLAGTMVFSLASCGNDYEYVTDKDTGIVSLEGSIPYGTISNWYALTYEDLRGDINVMIIKAAFSSTGSYDLYNVLINAKLATESASDRLGAINIYAERELGKVISIETLTKYLEMYETKGGYNLDDLNEIKKMAKEIKTKEYNNKILVKE